MKKQSFYPLKRFLSLLILDKDIVESNEQTIVSHPEINASLSDFSVAQEEKTLSPFIHSEESPISIQPEEIGGIEDIDTRIF